MQTMNAKTKLAVETGESFEPSAVNKIALKIVSATDGKTSKMPKAVKRASTKRLTAETKKRIDGAVKAYFNEIINEMPENQAMTDVIECFSR